MVIASVDEFKEKTVEQVAKLMCLAAKTAPKGKGIDLISANVIKGETILKLSQKMKEIGEREDNNTLRRDGENIKSAQVIVLLGTSIKSIGLKLCGFCGYQDCSAAERAKAICAFNTGDLGIAIGSAVSIAMDHRIDNRIMYSVGYAAMEMGLTDSKIKIAYGIPLSVSGKNPFFDRG